MSASSGKRWARGLAAAVLALLSAQRPLHVGSAEAQPYRWEGFYLGANFGATRPLNVGEHLKYLPLTPRMEPDLFPPSRERAGLSFGVQGGYNWRLGPFVYGLEADFNFLHGRGGRAGIVTQPMTYRDATVYGYALTYQTPATYFASLRGRLGTTLGDSLIYLTGGLATGGVRGPASLDFIGLEPRESLKAVESGSRRMKYVVGLGIERPIAADATVKFETLFLSQGLNNQYFVNASRDVFLSKIRNENIVARVGLNHQFGAENVFRTASPQDSGDGKDEEEIYSLHGVSTTVAQGYPKFRAAYSGKNSFNPNGQLRSGTISDLFLGMRLWDGAGAYVNPEMNQGFGLQNTVGSASYVNALTTRVGSAAPYMRMQRFFVRQIIGLGGGAETDFSERGSDSELLESTTNQIARRVDKDRLTITIGKYSVPDIFDDNVYAHDPTKDFLNYAFTSNGAFDYAADAWGYTYGAAAELKKSWWTARAGIFQLSQFPGRTKLDPILLHQFMTAGELEGRYELFGQPGILKLLAFSDNGNFGKFTEVNDVAIATGTAPNASLLRARRLKNGVGVNLAQQLMPNVGFFLRAGLDDGRYETVDYTDVNRTVAGGVVFFGDIWGRADDKIGVGASISGISAPFVRFLQLGGISAFVGDGALQYGGEKVFEAFYKIGLLKQLEATIDYQFIGNPGFNVSRGPVNAIALRLRAEF